MRKNLNGWSAVYPWSAAGRACPPAISISLTFKPSTDICSRTSTTGQVKSVRSRSARARSNFSFGNTSTPAWRTFTAGWCVRDFSQDCPGWFAKQAAVILGDVNFVHPFREGNGRAQLQYLKLLAEKAGHRLDLGRVDAKRWIEASQISHASNYDLMAQLVAEAIVE